MWCLRSWSPGNEKDHSTKAQLFFIEVIRLFTIEVYLLSSTVGQRSCRGQVHWTSVTISKGESLSVKGVDLRFWRSSGSAFGEGIWRISTNFANWVLIVLLICSPNSEDRGWSALWHCCKTGQTAQMSKHLVIKTGSQSLWSSRGLPRWGSLFLTEFLAK